jgi:diacylglycerol kinase family enzyme
MRALLLHNPTAGTAGHDKDSIVAALKLAGFATRYVSTKKDGAVEALREEADLIVVGGGDGTVRHTLTNMPDRTRPVGLLPLGSANNIARSLGIAGTPHELAERWRIDHVRPFNLGRVILDGEPSAFVEGFGLGVIAATILERLKGKKADGAEDLRRGRAVLRRVLEQAEPLDAAVAIDGRRIDGEFIGLEVLNTGFTGPGLPLACNADPGDGLLDVIGIAPAQRALFIDWIEAPLDCDPPVMAWRGIRIDVVWRGAPSRIDDKASKPQGEQHATVTLDDVPARVLMPVADPVSAHSKDRRGA